MGCIKSSIMSRDELIHIVQRNAYQPATMPIHAQLHQTPRKKDEENRDPAIKAQSKTGKHHVALATIPSFPSLSITPSFNRNVLSISLNGIRCKSRIFNACWIVKASRNCLRTFSPRLIRSISSCTASVIRCRAVTASRAGLDAVGKTVCGERRLKVLEWERVGLGLTGPIERREAAKSGSRPSRSIAVRKIGQRIHN